MNGGFQGRGLSGGMTKNGRLQKGGFIPHSSIKVSIPVFWRLGLHGFL
jgi:hypothetical protein